MILITASVLLAIYLTQRHLGYVPWAALALMTAVFVISPAAFVVLFLVGAAALYLNQDP